MYIKNIKELKKNLRARYRRYREKMNAEQKIRLDASIQCRLLTLEEYLHAETLFIYVSKPIEVDTLAVINAALANHKRVAVPRCVPDTFEMEFYYITSLSDLEKGTFGVLEPIVDKCERVGDITTVTLRSSAGSRWAYAIWGASNGICPTGITTGPSIF